MSPLELEQIFTRLWGAGWRAKASEELETHEATIRRWMAGSVPIPGPVKAWARAVKEIEHRKLLDRRRQRKMKQRRAAAESAS